ncbi:MAG: hypothetical protein ABEJ26_09310 [Halosimplex sp.]
MIRRRVCFGVGAVAVLAGIALTLRPGIVGSNLATALTLAVWAVALAGVGAAVYARLGSDGTPDGALPTAGERPRYDAPGDDIAAAVDSVGVGERDAAERDRIRERLRAGAVHALERYEGVARAEAAERVADGDWTDDPAAAALFAGRDDSVHEGVEPDFAERAERAAAAVDRLRERVDGGADAGTARHGGGGVADD